MTRGLFVLRAFVALAGLAAGGCDCGGEAAEIIVDLRTDFVPGVEFTVARVYLGPEASADASWPAGIGDDFIDGVRIATLDASNGSYDMHVDLFDGLGRVVATRAIRVSVQGRTIVTVVITRECRTVECPVAGGDPSLTVCEGGRCVDPSCRPERPELCPDPMCTTDGECPAMTCADGACAAGVCLLRPRAGACESDEWCEPETGCRPLEEVPDAGSLDAGPVDAGPPDAGPPDAGPPDAGGVDCTGAPVPTCAMAGSIGRLTSDFPGSGTRVGTGGTTAAWHRVTLSESMAGPLEDLTARVTLTNPAGANFDLHVYCTSCGGTELTAPSPTEPVEAIDLGIDDSIGVDNSTEIFIEIRFVSATVCGRWMLSVQGGITTSDRPCVGGD